MIEIGRLCVKIAGRDAGKKAIVIDILDKNFVMIDGEVRRRKCNITHIEPLNKVLKIKKNATPEEVKNVLKTEGIEVKTTKPKKTPARPRIVRKKKIKPVETKEKNPQIPKKQATKQQEKEVKK